MLVKDQIFKFSDRPTKVVTLELVSAIQFSEVVLS